jgi:shikimate kinase/3-dehydroquinate synthase
VVRFEPAAASLGEVVAGLSPSQVFVVTDATVERLWGARVNEALGAGGIHPKRTVVLEPGESHKHLGSVEVALRAMVEAGADRDSLVLGHGGGVVTDIAGFVAATLLRGVRWLGVPTTLLAMVDASVGGKTGVDLGLAKNAVGAFHQPAGVLVDVDHVATETDRAYRGGLAEIVKAACIADIAVFEALEAAAQDRRDGPLARRDRELVQHIALRAVAVKARIVGRDEREAGERALLNFGHTVGHALEAEGRFERLTHGEAVSLGMIAALRIGRRLGVTPPEVAARIEALLRAIGLPTNLDSQPLAAALPFVGLDKKRRAGLVRFVLLDALGSAVLHPLDPDELPSLLQG